ncbi:hypothetical protein GCM10009846_00870 [Agrococcus versicolor]|uniref:DUF11 domain-containing protein n=1 Tax=Agrococcus versicolor TaxID=501482 RepID=A0ABN3AJ32_9MICO
MRQRARTITDEARRHARGAGERPRARGGWPAAAVAATTLGLLLAGAGGAAAWSTTEPHDVPGPATTTLPGTLLEGGSTDGGTTTLLAYAAAGDEVVARLATTSRTPAGARVVVTDPTGAVVHDDAAPAAVGGTHLGGTWVAGAEGVWSIAVQDPDPGSGDGAALSWDVGVVRDGASIPGRVWTESLAIHTSAVTSLVVHAAAPDGAVYRVRLDGYDGIDSTLRMNDVGNAAAFTCEPAGRSVPMPRSPEADGAGAAYWQPSSADCDGLTAYRLFLDPPAPDLPASTQAWADRRTEGTWLRADYRSPSIDALAFARQGSASNAGELTGVLAGQPGVVRVEVDADGDGGFDGPADVVDEVAVLEPGAFSWRWDGVDATGHEVPTTATGVVVRATMAQVSPLHFLRIDAETSTGGIEVETLTGPAPGIASLHWDDTMLEPSSDRRWSRTPSLIGSDPATTSAGGVHGWEAGGERPNQNDGIAGSWGDLRSIDDWASIVDHAEATVAVPALADLRIDKRVDAEATLALDGSSASVRWTIEVGNLGAVDASGTVVADAYPAELDVASIVAETPTRGTFDAATGVWTVGTLEPGAVASLTFQGTIATTPGAAATVANAATVTSPQSPAVPGSCEPNDDLASDADRCDVVETPLTPTPQPATPAVAPADPSTPAASTPAASTPAPPAPARDATAAPAALGLPRTGGGVEAPALIGGALAIALGLGALLVRHRIRRS